MMGHRQVEQAVLFYEFSLERHIPADHLLRSIDRFVDLEQVRQDLAPFYGSIGRPSIDPELMAAWPCVSLTTLKSPDRDKAAPTCSRRHSAWTAAPRGALTNPERLARPRQLVVARAAVVLALGAHRRNQHPVPIGRLINAP